MTRLTAILCLTLALTGVAGCSLRAWLFGDPPPVAARPVAPVLPPPTAPPADPALEPAAPPVVGDSGLDQLRSDAAALKGQLAAKQAEIKDREAAVAAAKREADQAPLRALCRWAAYIGAGAAIAGVVLAGVVALASSWWPLLRMIPLGWKSGALLAAAGALAFGASQALAASLPWIGAAAIITVVVVLLGLLAWSALTWKRGGVAMASELRTYAGELPEIVRARLDEGSRDRQGRAAVVGDHLLEVARAR
jgi:hypothetical protein